MRILLLSPLCPLPLEKGGAVRLWNIARELSKNHSVDLLCFIRHEGERRYEDALKKVFRNVTFVIRRPLVDRSALQSGVQQFPRFISSNLSLLSKTFVSSRPLLSHLYTSDEFRKFVLDADENGAYDLLYAETFYVLSSIYDHIQTLRTKLLLIEQNIESKAYERQAETQKNFVMRTFMHIDVAKIEREERYFWKNVPIIGGLSPVDISIMRDAVHRDPMILENGVDIHWFSEQVSNRVSQEVLFVGSFTYFQNVDSLTWLIREVWPKIVAYPELADVRLRIVGRGADSSLKKFVRDAGFSIDSSVDDIREAMQRATVLIAPIRAGSGTKYKILESLASRLPVVTTRIGAEGLSLRDGVDAYISDTEAGLAEKVKELLINPKIRHSMSEKGFAYVASNYDWNILVSSFLKKLEGYV